MALFRMDTELTRAGRYPSLGNDETTSACMRVRGHVLACVRARVYGGMGMRRGRTRPGRRVCSRVTVGAVGEQRWNSVRAVCCQGGGEGDVEPRSAETSQSWKRKSAVQAAQRSARSQHDVKTVLHRRVATPGRTSMAPGCRTVQIRSSRARQDSRPLPCIWCCLSCSAAHRR